MAFKAEVQVMLGNLRHQQVWYVLQNQVARSIARKHSRDQCEDLASHVRLVLHELVHAAQVRDKA